jgi:hypothetical protein
MAIRPTWSGSIQISLVSISVRIFPATPGSTNDALETPIRGVTKGCQQLSNQEFERWDPPLHVDFAPENR